MIESGVKSIVTKNLLKYAAGRAITCPRKCGRIMDARTTVLYGNGGVMCASCWDLVADAITGKEPGMEVTDGRVVFARAPRAKNPAAPKVKRGAFGVLYRGYIERLKDLGCVLCPTCNAYLAPTHNHQEVNA